MFVSLILLYLRARGWQLKGWAAVVVEFLHFTLSSIVYNYLNLDKLHYFLMSGFSFLYIENGLDRDVAVRLHGVYVLYCAPQHTLS